MASSLKLTVFAAILLMAPNAPAAVYQLQRSNECSEVSAAVSDWAAAQVIARYRFHARRWHHKRPKRSAKMSRRARPARQADMSMAPAATAPASEGAVLGFAGSGAEAEAGPGSYTGTNLQEVAVDEADLVKTDGKFIYLANDGEVLILESWPPEETSMVARVSLPDGAQPNTLYLYEDTLLVLSQVSLRFGARLTTSHGTRITYIDVTNRARPAIERHVDLEGALVQSRLIGHDLYLVSNGGMQLPQWLLQRGHRIMERAGSTSQQRLAWQLRRSLTRAEVATLMPRMRSHRINGRFRPLVTCASTFVPRTPGQTGQLTLTHLRLNRHESPRTLGVLGGGLHVYASKEALYVASNGGKSEIHKFQLHAGTDLEPTYVGSGAVSGHLLNQFSMSEHRGFLRVATTDGGGNNLFVLGENQTDDALEVVGAVRGLARGERIFAARMFGDKGYIVTFRQTDPLYTLDLSDPSSPRVVGELKINGFSSYIHPLDDNRLLTIGQDADSRGRLQGVHLQIFDVSNPAFPTRTHHHRLGHGSQSVAQTDHHAFTYDPRTQTLAIPAQQVNRGQVFSGLLVMRIDADQGFSELGRVSHADRMGEYWEHRCRRERPSPRHACAQRHVTHSRVTMLRSIVMEDFLYSLSSIALEVNHLEAMERTVAATVLSARPMPRTRLSMR